MESLGWDEWSSAVSAIVLAVVALMIFAINLLSLWQARRYTKSNSARTDLALQSVELLEARVARLEHALGEVTRGGPS